MYPSVFNHFWDIARYRWRVTGFWQFLWVNERFFTTFCFPLGTLLGQSKCHTVGKRIQCLSNASQHVPIYLQPFLRYSKLLVKNCDIFTPHLCLAAPRGVTPLEFRKDLDTHKTRMNGLLCGEEIMTIRSAVLIQYQATSVWQTDGRTSSLYLLRASA